MFHGRVAARRAPARAIRLQRRTFLGGALEIDHEAILAAKKRRRLRSFVLGALQPRDTDLAAIRAAEDALAGFAPSGVFSKKATLEAAVGEAESVLLALPELSQLKLDLMSFELEKPEEPAAPPADAAAATPADDASTPGAAAAPTPTMPPPPAPLPGQPGYEPPPIVPDEVSDEAGRAVSSLRMALALRQLPALWSELEAASKGEAAAEGGGVALPAVVDAARTLGTGDVPSQLALHLRLAAPDLPEGLPPTHTELRAASERVLGGVQPLLFELLARSDMLQAAEVARLEPLRAKPERLAAEVKRQTLGMRAMVLLRQRPAPSRAAAVGGGATDRPQQLLEAAAAEDAPRAGVYSALQAEADAQLLMMDAFFGYSDRQATRRRRAIFSAKAFGVWVSLNILDIFLANV